MMKQTKTIVTTAIITLLTLGAVIYTSCRKDHCKHLVCQHGGTCNNGFCLCTTGYTGSYCEVPNTATISFKNRTFTRVYMTIGGVDYRVDSGTTMTITGGFGDSLKGTATAHGAYGINVPISPIRVGFPTSADLGYNLDVDSNYFFLKVLNSNPTVPNVTQVHVINTNGTVTDVVLVPNDNSAHSIGYYQLSATTQVDLEWTPFHWHYNALGLLPTTPTTRANLVYTALAN